MGLMKLSLFLFLLVVSVVAVAARSLAFTKSTKNSARAHGATDNAFFEELTSRQMAEDNGRLLSQSENDKKNYKDKFFSYDALRKNNIPCGRHGKVYYDCTKKEKANTYRRGCTASTGCARFTD